MVSVDRKQEWDLWFAAFGAVSIVHSAALGTLFAVRLATEIPIPKMLLLLPLLFLTSLFIIFLTLSFARPSSGRSGSWWLKFGYVVFLALATGLYFLLFEAFWAFLLIMLSWWLTAACVGYFVREAARE